MTTPWELAQPYIRGLMQQENQAQASADNIRLRMIEQEIGRQNTGQSQGFRMQELAQRDQYSQNANTVAFDRQLQRDDNQRDHQNDQLKQRRSYQVEDRDLGFQQQRDQTMLGQQLLSEREMAKGDYGTIAQPQSQARRYGSGNSGLTATQNFEGFRSVPYNDPQLDSNGKQRGPNIWRGGYGSNTYTTADGKVHIVTQNSRISRDDAQRDYDRRMQTEFVPKIVGAVGADTWANLSAGTQQALKSVTYNYGSLPKQLHAAVKSGDPNNIAHAIRSLASHNGGINKARRYKEAAMVGGGGTGIAAPFGENQYGTGVAQNDTTPLLGLPINQHNNGTNVESLDLMQPWQQEYYKDSGYEISGKPVYMTEQAYRALDKPLQQQFQPILGHDKNAKGKVPYARVQPLKGKNTDNDLAAGVRRPENAAAPVKVQQPRRIKVKDGKVQVHEGDRSVTLPD